MITAPSVDLVYATARRPAAEDFLRQQIGTTDADDSVVLAGRSCYQSFGRNYEPTADDADYIAHALHEVHHWSIAEHAYFTFYIRGISRSCSHEFVRHRQHSYSQLSQRYVPSNDVECVCPIEYLDDPTAKNLLTQSFSASVRAYEDLANHTATKLTPNNKMTTGAERTEIRKRARQSARSVLPNCAETRMVVSGNSRAWFEAMGKRYDPHAEPEIRRLFGEYILPILKVEAPETFRPFSLPEVN